MATTEPNLDLPVRGLDVLSINMSTVERSSCSGSAQGNLQSI